MSARDHILQALIDDAWLGYEGEGEGESAGLSSDDLYGIADAILASAWLAEHDRKVKAEALRTAAAIFATGGWQDAFLAGDVEDDVSAVQATEAWFNTRADRIEADDA